MQKLYWAVQKIYWALQKKLLGSGKLYWAVQNMNWGTQTINTRAARGDWIQLLNYIILDCESRMSIGQYKSTFWLIHHVLEFWTDPANQLTWWSGLPRSLELDRGFAVPQVPALGCAPWYWMTINLGSTATNITSGLNEIHASWSGRKYWTLQCRGKKLESWNCEVLQPPVAAGGKAR